jgi:hypothetical protein
MADAGLDGLNVDGKGDHDGCIRRSEHLELKSIKTNMTTRRYPDPPAPVRVVEWFPIGRSEHKRVLALMKNAAT